MFSKTAFLSVAMAVCVLSFATIIAPVGALAMGGKPEMTKALTSEMKDAETSDITLAELAKVYWPDNNATEVQKEEMLKKLLGKRVTWEITIAEIQRQNEETFLIQGQSDETMLGTFSYVQPQNEAESQQILSVSRGSKLNITGIVSEMQMRHLVLQPARLVPVLK